MAQNLAQSIRNIVEAKESGDAAQIEGAINSWRSVTKAFGVPDVLIVEGSDNQPSLDLTRQYIQVVRASQFKPLTSGTFAGDATIITIEEFMGTVQVAYLDPFTGLEIFRRNESGVTFDNVWFPYVYDMEQDTAQSFLGLIRYQLEFTNSGIARTQEARHTTIASVFGRKGDKAFKMSEYWAGLLADYRALLSSKPRNQVEKQAKSNAQRCYDGCIKDVQAGAISSEVDELDRLVAGTVINVNNYGGNNHVSVHNSAPISLTFTNVARLSQQAKWGIVNALCNMEAFSNIQSYNQVVSEFPPNMRYSLKEDNQLRGRALNVVDVCLDYNHATDYGFEALFNALQKRSSETVAWLPFVAALKDAGVAR